MTEFEKRFNGLIYDAFDKEIMEDQKRTRRLIDLYNSLSVDDEEKKQEILHQLFPHDDFGLYRIIESPLFIDNYKELKIGKNFYANIHFSYIGGCHAEIGDNVFIGPYCVLATGMHAYLPEERNIKVDKDGTIHDYEYGRPIKICSNVWIASNVTICGGVTIGEGCVIGAGSVVTRDIPPHSLAAGNPCRVIRPITEEDRLNK